MHLGLPTGVTSYMFYVFLVYAYLKILCVLDLTMNFMLPMYYGWWYFSYFMATTYCTPLSCVYHVNACDLNFVALMKWMYDISF